jgi:SAM-dependent methyltransferase
MPWYREWFESPFYDLLYQHRDEEEARNFISNIFNLLPIPNNSKILDLACGNGRHCVWLANYGHVCGTDINPSQIAKAQTRNIPNSSFFVHDMRIPFGVNKYDFIFNIFSSFGYFDNAEQDELCLKNIATALTIDGYFIHDFLNLSYVLNTLNTQTEIVKKGTFTFEVTRKFEDDFIHKNILIFEESKIVGEYQEKVRAYDQSRLMEIHKKNGLEIMHTFGDYDLSTLSPKNSPRLILISRKSK